MFSIKKYSDKSTHNGKKDDTAMQYSYRTGYFAASSTALFKSILVV